MLYILMFIVELLTIAKKWKYPGCPSRDEQVKKMQVWWEGWGGGNNVIILESQKQRKEFKIGAWRERLEGGKKISK